MKRAEALVLRTDAQKRIEQLKQRLVQNAQVQEGDEPAERPERLLREFAQTADELTSPNRRINRTNAATAIEPEMTISAALALRDVLTLKQATSRSFAQAAVVSQTQYARTEIKSVSTVDVAAMQRAPDELARQRRELDFRIQAPNRETELVE